MDSKTNQRETIEDLDASGSSFVQVPHGSIDQPLFDESTNFIKVSSLDRHFDEINKSPMTNLELVMQRSKVKKCGPAKSIISGQQ